MAVKSKRYEDECFRTTASAFGIAICSCLNSRLRMEHTQYKCLQCQCTTDNNTSNTFVTRCPYSRERRCFRLLRTNVRYACPSHHESTISEMTNQTNPQTRFPTALNEIDPERPYSYNRSGLIVGVPTSSSIGGIVHRGPCSALYHQ